MLQATNMNEKKPQAPMTPFPELFVDDDIDASRLKKIAPVNAEPPFITVQRDYPRVANAIEMTWGHRELDSYLQKLIVADRGDRVGFPQPVLAALLKLYQQHTTQFNFPHTADTWSPDANSKQMHTLGFPKAEDVWADDPMSKHAIKDGRRNNRRG